MTTNPNILWIYGEDLYPDLACYGTPTVQTPHIDRLASEGTTFKNAFVTCPVCSPSRSAIITSRYQTAIGAHNHRSQREVPLPENVALITEHFREAGYFTCNSPGPGLYDRVGKTDFNFARDRPFDGTDWSQRAPGQPFYAQLNIMDTHRDFVRDPDSPIDPSTVDLPPYYPDHPLARADWAHYLESIQVLDRKVGSILQRLEDEDLERNTIVFFISDHGRAHVRDKQFLYDGGLRVPCIVRWPGQIDSNAVSERLVSGIDFAASALDLCNIAPFTSLDGQSFFTSVLRPAIFAARDRCDGTDDRIRCVRTDRYKYIRNLQPERPYMQFNAYKKHQYPVWTLMRVLHERNQLDEAQSWFMVSERPAQELYDVDGDPYELRNLANAPNHAAALSEHSDLLDAWQIEHGDLGLVDEDQAVMESEDVQMRNNYEERMRARGLDPAISDLDYLNWWMEHFAL